MTSEPTEESGGSDHQFVEQQTIAMDALRSHRDREGIAQGLAEMEAGLGRQLDEALDDLRTRLGFG
jgi:hypothetical protein